MQSLCSFQMCFVFWSPPNRRVLSKPVFPRALASSLTGSLEGPIFLLYFTDVGLPDKAMVLRQSFRRKEGLVCESREQPWPREKTTPIRVCGCFHHYYP